MRLSFCLNANTHGNAIERACEHEKISYANLDIDDIDFEERECVVLGKGDKERMVTC